MDSLSKITGGKAAVMIYFSSQTCQACKGLRPRVADMMQMHFPRIEFVEVDAAENPIVTAEASVFTAPVILVFFEGKEYLRESKYISVDQLQEKISRYYNMLFDKDF